MTELHRRLLRDLPDRRSARAGDFNTEARAVRHWVSALPLANFSATARMLADALRAMNRLKVGAAERLEALEILRGTVTQLATLIDKQIVGASFPLPPQRAEIGVLAQEFQSELSLGYRMALHDFCAPNGSVPMLRGKQVALAAQRALSHGGARLQKAYLLYRTPPKGAWQGMHDTFRFIASLGLDNKAVDDVVLGASISARTAYAHALLLALANPYRYAQREMLEVIALTCTFAPYCELSQAPDETEAMHPVDFDSDQGPGYLPEERTPAADGAFSVRLGALLDYIESQISSLPPGIRLATFRMRGGPPLQVDIDLAQRLVDSWTSDGSRDHSRLTGGHTLDTVVGLNAMHFVLAGNEDFEVFLRGIRGSSIQMSEQSSAASWTMGTAEQLRAVPQPATILDQSLGGYRLVWAAGSQGSAVRAKVGELVGLSLPDSGAAVPDWMVGVIRWMRIDDHGSVDAGIGLLARRSLAIGINALDNGGNPMADRRGILLSPMQSEECAIYSSLLTPGLFERETDVIQLTLPADPHRWPSSACVVKVTGAGIMESAGAYLRFALPPMELPDEGLGRSSEPALMEN